MFICTVLGYTLLVFLVTADGLQYEQFLLESYLCAAPLTQHVCELHELSSGFFLKIYCAVFYK